VTELAASDPAFSHDDLLAVMDGYEPPPGPTFNSFASVCNATADEIEAATNRYHFRSILFNRISDTWGEDALFQTTLLLGWPSDIWHTLDKWGTRLNGYATADDAPQWLVELRGRQQ
jgi:hypothetical protein